MARILIVQDEVLVGLMLAAAVEDAGHAVVGPFMRSAPAVDAVTAGAVDAALLDVDLGRGETSYPVAQALKTSGRPFAFLTGHTRERVDTRFADVALLHKPVSDCELRQVISALVH